MSRLADAKTLHPDKGPGIVMAPEDGQSYWQPAPSHGYVTVKLSPFNFPSNLFSTGIQVIAPRGSLREHAHARNEELLFVFEGYGHALIDGKKVAVQPGSLVYAGRWVKHGLVNESAGEMKVFWVFFPPGLENVLEGLGVPRRAGDTPPQVERPPNVSEILSQGWFATEEQIARKAGLSE